MSSGSGIFYYFASLDQHVTPVDNGTLISRFKFALKFILRRENRSLAIIGFGVTTG